MEETYGAHLRCLENTAKSDFAVQKWSPHQKKKKYAVYIIKDDSTLKPQQQEHCNTYSLEENAESCK